MPVAQIKQGIYSSWYQSDRNDSFSDSTPFLLRLSAKQQLAAPVVRLPERKISAFQRKKKVLAGQLTQYVNFLVCDEQTMSLAEPEQLTSDFLLYLDEETVPEEAAPFLRLTEHFKESDPDLCFTSLQKALIAESKSERAIEMFTELRRKAGKDMRKTMTDWAEKLKVDIPVRKKVKK